jgi:hypothetical protein
MNGEAGWNVETKTEGELIAAAAGDAASILSQF